MRPCLWLALACAAGFLTFAPAAKPAPRLSWGERFPDEDPELPAGFVDSVIATGLTGVTALAAAPDGRLFVCEQKGSVRVIKDDALLPRPFVAIEVDSFWERGLIGITLDPDFPAKPHVYLCYVAAKPYPHHRVSRFTARGDMAEPGSEVILFRGDDQRKLGGFQPGGHQGGALHFGKDGKLYVAIGDQTAGSPAQRMDTVQGKVLRLNADGSIPEDNPFFKMTQGKYRAIWALGLRNPFTFAVQPGTGRLYINDVGNARIEEINEGVAGSNYGWPDSEGPTTNPRHRNPVFAYDRNVGRSISGGTFYNPPQSQFPARFAGKYFFCDFMDGWIRVLDPEHPDTAAVFATGLSGPVDIVTAPDGSLCYLNRKAWTIDDKFKPATGSVHRITHGNRAAKPVPRITQQPRGRTVAADQPASFHLAAEGQAPLAYRWTRNGSDIPGARGPEYILPAVRLADDEAEFRCLVTNPLGNIRSARATLRVLPLREAVRPAGLVPGLVFRSFEGCRDVLPDFETLRPVKTGVVPAIALSRQRDGGIGFVFQGFLDIPADGVYTFEIDSAGVSKLFVGSDEVAATSGRASHSGSGQTALRAGQHPFRLLYAQAAGTPRLDVWYAGPGVPRQAIPATRFSNADLDVLAPPVLSPAGGVFTGPVRVRLTAPSAHATIRYTTDGMEPSADSPVYEQPLLLDHSARLRARSFRGGAADRAEAAADFTIDGHAPFGLAWRELVTTLNVPAEPAELPPLLSRTGVFRSLTDLAPNRGIIPYDVNAPLWSDGADKHRWLALPGDARIGFTATGEWHFPAGTVFIKHFELAPEASRLGTRRRLETRLLVVGTAGGGYGVTYKWRPDQQDADLLQAGSEEEVPVRTGSGTRVMRWSYPSRADCLACHTSNAGFVLGVKTRQLNRPFTYPETGITDNQLRAWNHIDLFAAPPREADLPSYSRLAAVTDRTASLEHRARSYLDANCAQCHRPGGARGLFDARFDTPLRLQQLINGPLAAEDLSAAGTKLIAPCEPARSAIHDRMSRRHHVLAMPPLATNRVDETAVSMLVEWIKSLPKAGRP